MADYSLSTVDKLFKTVFGKLSEKLYNSQNVMVARAAKNFNFTGDSLKISMPGGFGGSVGSGSLPTSNVKPYLQASITTKSLYGRLNLDRKSMYAAKDDKGSFVRLLKEGIENTVESWMRNMNRILFGDGTGALGTMAGTNTGTGTVGDPYVVLISDATYHEARLEEKDYVNVGTDTTTLFEIVENDVATKTIKLVTISGAVTIGAADTDIIYMQGSKDNDPIGLKNTVGDNTSTIYGIDQSAAGNRRFQSTREDANGAEISPQLINKVVQKIHKKCGKYPNMVVTSYEQFIKLENQLENQKYVLVRSKDESLKSKIGFDAIEIIAGARKVPVLIDRFCELDEMWLLNDDHIKILHQPGFGWFDDDGTVLLRQANSDGYEARYGGYLEVFIKPNFHGQIHNLAV